MVDDSAVIGLGANLGSREAALRAATAMLAATPGCEVRRLSAIYLTDPLGPPQPSFLNAAVELRTSLGPEALLDRLQLVERTLGRERRERWGPRVIDLDVLWMESGPWRTHRIAVPHPGLEARAFALAPLLDVAPGLAARYGLALAAAGGKPPCPVSLAAAPAMEDDGQGGAVRAVGLDAADACALVATAIAWRAQGAPAAMHESRSALLARPDDPQALVRGTIDAMASGFRIGWVVVDGDCARWIGTPGPAVDLPDAELRVTVRQAANRVEARGCVGSGRPRPE